METMNSTPQSAIDSIKSKPLLAAHGQHAPAFEPPDGVEEGRVRDAVFSNKLRELERRQARFEEKLLKDIGQLRSELGARVEALEARVRAELEAVAARQTRESQDRQAADKQLSDEAHLVKTSLGSDQENLRHELAKCEREQRQALLDTAKKLTADIQRLQDELQAELRTEIRGLDDAKVARTSLAAMLGEAIVQLHAGQTLGGSGMER